MSKATEKGMVSIIIPAYNEEKNIANCLRSLAKQTYKNIEIVLVNDSSTDKTKHIALRENSRLKLNFNMLNLKRRQERGKARNLGARQAKGDYLLFIDADMIPTNKVIEECVAGILKESNMGAIIIPEESFGQGFWTKARTLERKCYLGDDSIEAARFFSRKVFWEVDGWDEEMVSGEDWDLTRRVKGNYKIERIKAKILHNEGKLTIWRIARKKFYYASKAQIYLKKYPLRPEDIVLFIFRPAYFRNWKLFLVDPIHGIGVFILKFVEIIAGGLGFLYSKMLNPLSVFL